MAEDESLTPVWALLGVMAAFIAGFTVLVLCLQPTTDNLMAQLAINWPKLLVLLFIGVGPLIAWLRMLKVRAKRGRLVREEWYVEREREPWLTH